MNKAEVWDRPLMGRGGETVDEFTKEEQKKKIMLERFQDEACHGAMFIVYYVLYAFCYNFCFHDLAPWLRLLQCRV